MEEKSLIILQYHIPRIQSLDPPLLFLPSSPISRRVGSFVIVRMTAVFLSVLLLVLEGQNWGFETNDFAACGER